VLAKKSGEHWRRKRGERKQKGAKEEEGSNKGEKHEK